MNYKIVNSESIFMDDVISLGDNSSQTVGHLPQVVFRDYADKGGLLIAFDQNKLHGYILFRKLKRSNIIKIAQVCIETSSRGLGISDSLITFLKNKFNNSFREIQLTCRKDYKNATTVWRRNNFYPIGEKKGRGKNPSTLVFWSYKLSKPDLFSTSTYQNVRAVVDVNIIVRTRDLYKEGDYPENPIIYLYADNLTSDVDYYYANESLIEVLEDDNNARRTETREILNQFLKLKMNSLGVDDIYTELCEISPPKSSNDVSDRKQLAETIANNVEYFITTDENMIKSFKGQLNQFNLNILTPTEFIIHFDKIQNESTYFPRNFGALNTNLRKPTELELNSCVNQFFDYNGESKYIFKSKFRNLIAKDDTTIKIIEFKGKILGIIIYSISDSISLEIIRISNYKNKYVLFNQIVNYLIKEATTNKTNHIEINAEDLDEEMVDLLRNRYFYQMNDSFHKILEYGFVSRSSLENLESLEANFGIVNDNKETPISDYDLERAIYPGKLQELEIENIIIPIKPYWAGQLFENRIANQTLFGAEEKLIWNRSNIYYRSTRPNIEKPPCRILWYVSSNSSYSNRTKGIVACSYLDEVYIDGAKSLYKRFKNLGTYEWSNIKDMVKGDVDKKIKALEFSDTEVFEKEVPLERIQALLSKRHTFAGPLKITNSDFKKIYQSKS